jgi:hypothetical protein
VTGTIEATTGFTGIQTSDVPELAAGKITSGTFHIDRIPALSYAALAGSTTQAFSVSTLTTTGTSTFGSDGLLHINSRATTYGSETVGLQTTIDDRALTDANPGTHGDESRNVLALQPDGGRVGIGTISPGYTLDVAGDIYATGDVTASSDRRLKTDIKRIENALDKVCSLGGYTYVMNDKPSSGLIAQEVLEVLPEVVHGSEETNYSLAYGNIVGLLVEAIKELKEKVG